MKPKNGIADRIGGFIGRQPWRSMWIALAIFVLAAAVNFALHKAFPHVPIGSPLFLPFAQSRLDFSPWGLGYLLVFMLMLLWAARASVVPNDAFRVWIIGLALILVGNLIQGDPDVAFRQPLLATNFQYYHDALRIESWPSWVEWLANFNAKQQGLLLHSRTHPPFAVLIHYLALQLLGERPLRIGLALAVIASLSVPLVKAAFAELGIRAQDSSRLAILLAVVPAVNIFTAVSLDGLVLTAATIFLLGMLILLRRPRFSWLGILLFLAGAFLMNLLTFAGAFTFAVGFLVGAWELLTRRSSRVFLSTGAALLLFVVLAYGLLLVTHYDHLQALFTATRLENPQGLRLLANPLDYLATRMECFAEVAFFLSIPVLAAIIPLVRNSLTFEARSLPQVRISLAAMLFVGLLFLVGAPSVGETARSFMFIYPFMLLLLWDQNPIRIMDLTVLAGIQTAAMQLFGYYFW